MKSCCAVNCTSRCVPRSKLSFYRFPPEGTELRKRWVQAIRRVSWQPTEYSYVCSRHFVSGKRSKDPLSPDYVPSVFTFTSSPAKAAQLANVHSYERRVSCTEVRLRNAAAQQKAAKVRRQEQRERAFTRSRAAAEEAAEEAHRAASALLRLGGTVDDLNKECISVGTQTDMSGEDIQSALDECNQMRQEMQLLKDSAVSDFSQERLSNDHDRVKFYTGLPCYRHLHAVFRLASRSLDANSSTYAVPLFSQFVAVLSKLRLNLTNQDIAYRLNVDQTTFSRYFHRWLNILYIRLSPLVQWPDQEILRQVLPRQFKSSFPRCIAIIDCFEVFAERPSDLKAKAQSYSNYKHHQTVKFLISICPTGVITFISRGWGGRTSDKYLTEQCGILRKLLPGDELLADRGFNIAQSVGSYGAVLKIPPFTKGRKQLPKEDVDLARKLSRVRIHIERAISLLRGKYTILSSTVPIEFIKCTDGSGVSTLDKIAFVGCALCNCCESIIPAV